MGEATFQLDWLMAAIGTAKRRQGSPYWKRNYVISLARQDEQRYKNRREYRLAMWMRHLRQELERSNTTNEVLVRLNEAFNQPPTSNTGANPDEMGNEPRVTRV